MQQIQYQSTGESRTDYNLLEEGKLSPFDEQKKKATKLQSVVQQNLANVQGVVNEAKQGPKGCCSKLCPSPWLVLPGVLSGLCGAGIVDSYYLTEDEFGKIAYPFGTFMSLCLYGVLWCCLRKARTGDLLLENVNKFEDLSSSVVALHVSSCDTLDQAVHFKESVIPEMNERIARIETEHAEASLKLQARIDMLQSIQNQYDQLSQSVGAIPGNNDRLRESIRHLMDLAKTQSTQPHIDLDELKIIVGDTNDHTAGNDQQRQSVSIDLAANLQNQAYLVAALNDGIHVIAEMLSRLETENKQLNTLQDQIAEKDAEINQRLDEEVKLQAALIAMKSQVEPLVAKLEDEEELKARLATAQEMLMSAQGALTSAESKVATLQSANKDFQEHIVQIQVDFKRLQVLHQPNGPEG